MAQTDDEDHRVGDQVADHRQQAGHEGDQHQRLGQRQMHAEQGQQHDLGIILNG